LESYLLFPQVNLHYLYTTSIMTSKPNRVIVRYRKRQAAIHKVLPTSDALIKTITEKGNEIMFTLHITSYQLKEHYSETVLKYELEYSLVSVPLDEISNMNGKTCLRIESD